MGGILLGDVVPDFDASTTTGPMPSFHHFIEGSWAVLFSHPGRAWHTFPTTP